MTGRENYNKRGTDERERERGLLGKLYKLIKVLTLVHVGSARGAGEQKIIVINFRQITRDVYK